MKKEGDNLSTPFLSLIIPIYNAEKYLRDCMDSVIEQSFSDMEILCIDDGSTDSSPEIIDEYARKDYRIHVKRKPNGGLVSVRKLAAVEAKGKYIGFVDSDDWIDSAMYERLCKVARSNDADMVSSNYWQEGSYSNVSHDALEPGVYDEENIVYLREHMILDLDKHDKGMSGSLCTKIFRADIFRKIIEDIPNEVRVSEDKIISLTFLLECNKVVVLDEAYYHYRINQDSMFHVNDSDYLLNYHLVYNYFKTLFTHENFTENMRTQAELYIVQFLIKGINTQMGFSFRNLMWIDPSWIEEQSIGEHIAVYGKGELGKTYETHIKNKAGKIFAGYIDIDSQVKRPQFDSVVIAIKNKDAAVKAKEDLIKAGIPEEKILWFNQEEVFWKYADAMGLNRR